MADVPYDPNTGLTHPVRNEDLPAGSPMYYYCEKCGGISDIKPEDFDPRTDPVKHICQNCLAK